jgi:hypothetical protein
MRGIVVVLKEAYSGISDLTDTGGVGHTFTEREVVIASRSPNRSEGCHSKL